MLTSLLQMMFRCRYGNICLALIAIKSTAIAVEPRSRDIELLSPLDEAVLAQLYIVRAVSRGVDQFRFTHCTLRPTI